MYASTYKGGIALLCLVVLTLLIYYAINSLYIEDNNIFYNTYGSQLDQIRINEMLKQAIKGKWIGYLIIPVVILIRISFTSVCIFLGCFLADLKVKFNELFKIAILADFVFIISGVIKLFFLIFFVRVNTLDDLQVQPLSLLSLLDKDTLDIFYIYPLSVINVFEALYVLVLVWLISDFIGHSFLKSFKTIATSYGVGLLFWVLFFMFMNITLT